MRLSPAVSQRHGPAHGLRELVAEIAGEREEARLLHRMKDRKLAPFQPVLPVEVDLAHHVQHRPVTGDEKALLAVGGKAHVLIVQRHGLCRGDRLLAGAFEVEGRLPLALRLEHAVIEGAGHQHGAESADQRVRRQKRVPRPHRLRTVIQHAHQPIGQVARLPGRGRVRRACAFAGGRQVEIAEVRNVPGPETGFGYLKLQADAVFAHSLLHTHNKLRGELIPMALECIVDRMFRRGRCRTDV